LSELISYLSIFVATYSGASLLPNDGRQFLKGSAGVRWRSGH